MHRAVPTGTVKTFMVFIYSRGSWVIRENHAPCEKFPAIWHSMGNHSVKNATACSCMFRDSWVGAIPSHTNAVAPSATFHTHALSSSPPLHASSPDG